MAVDERARRHLHERLDETIGPEAADVLMEELALLGREHLATRNDVVAVRHDVELLRRDMDTGFERLRADLHERLNEQQRYLIERFERSDERFDAMNERFDAMNARFDAMTTTVNARLDAAIRQLLFWMLGAIMTVAGLAFGAAQLS